MKRYKRDDADYICKEDNAKMKQLFAKRQWDAK